MFCTLISLQCNDCNVVTNVHISGPPCEQCNTNPPQHHEDVSPRSLDLKLMRMMKMKIMKMMKMMRMTGTMGMLVAETRSSAGQ